MCGLIFAASKWTLSNNDVDIFKKMLIADQFRGEHSTGVFSLYHPYGKDRYFNVVKEAMSGSVFANDIAFKKAVNGLKHAVQTGNTVTGINSPRVLFGHNRYATVGAVNEKNAHPFTHGHITLAHNGTLRNQSLLPDHKKFEVDSENIAYSISTIGVEETIKKLNGAFALIWYDDNEQTINFLRNDEREFHLFETEGGDWFGCSEEKMGEWILTRGKTPKRIKRHFELEPGTQYIFDVSKGLELKEERKHELPSFPVYGYSRSSWYDDYESDYELYPNQRQREAQTQKRSVSSIPLSHNSLLSKHGIKERVGENISYETYQFKPYQGNVHGNGEIIGWIADSDEYVEIRICSVNEKYFQMDKIATATIVSAYEYNKILHIICRCDDYSKLYNQPTNVIYLPSVVENMVEESVDEQEEQEEETLVAETGQSFTKKDWEKSDLNDCCYCSNPIPFEDLPKTSIHNSCFSFCSDCIGEYEKEQEEEQEEDDDIPFDVSKDLEERIEDIDEAVDLDIGEYCKACDTYHNKDVVNGNITHEEYKKLDPLCRYHWSLSNKFRTISLSQLVKKPLGWCDVCGVIHSEEVLKGNFTLAYWNALPVSCPVKIEFKDKFTKELRPTLCFDKNTRRITAVHKANAERRPIDIFYSVPCPVCTITHSHALVAGEVDHNVYKNMIEGCPVKDYWMKEYHLK